MSLADEIKTTNERLEADPEFAERLMTDIAGTLETEGYSLLAADARQSVETAGQILDRMAEDEEFAASFEAAMSEDPVAAASAQGIPESMMGMYLAAYASELDEEETGAFSTIGCAALGAGLGVAGYAAYDQFANGHSWGGLCHSHRSYGRGRRRHCHYR